MPQDIPLEASETLVFTPASLESLGDAAPTFRLRACTTRDKRYHRRLHTEEGVFVHSVDDIRREVDEGLKALWSDDVYAEHSQVLKEFWEAQDQFALQAKDDPDLTFEYDPEIRRACEELTRKVADAWRPLRRLLADNSEYGEMSMPLMVAVVVKGWSGLDVPLHRERGYITLDNAEAVRDALKAIEEANKLPKGTAWTELFIACTKGMYLDQDEAKNSASPSPSETTPPASSETPISEPDGASPASASSTETPVTA